MITIEIFTANICSRCAEAKIRIELALEQMDQKNYICKQVDVVEEIDYSVSMGILTTPTIVINGKVIFTSLPTVAQLKIALQPFSDIE